MRKKKKKSKQNHIKTNTKTMKQANTIDSALSEKRSHAVSPLSLRMQTQAQMYIRTSIYIYNNNKLSTEKRRKQRRRASACSCSPKAPLEPFIQRMNPLRPRVVEKEEGGIKETT